MDRFVPFRATRQRVLRNLNSLIPSSFLATIEELGFFERSRSLCGSSIFSRFRVCLREGERDALNVMSMSL